MKIRTVTFFKEYNCGAVLQAYALSRYLGSIGNGVEILNYDPFYESEKKTIHNAKDFLLVPYRILRERNFKSFRDKYLSLSKEVFSKQDLEDLEDCDLYITGSDQVWNPHLTHGYDDIFFLNFDTSAAKMSYSASYGRDDISEEYIGRVKEYTKEYCAVSVRENNLKECLEKVGVRAQYTVDPVFLLDADHYRSISKRCSDDRYLLIYTKSQTDDIWEFARRIAEKLNLKIIDTSKIQKMKGVDKVRPLINPPDFLGLIDGADIVLTNSFHGTAFSIIFNKNFYCLSAGKANVRLESLLSLTGLESRMIQDMDVDLQDIDYSYTNEKMDEFVSQSKVYIHEGIEKAKRYRNENNNA